MQKDRVKRVLRYVIPFIAFMLVFGFTLASCGGSESSTEEVSKVVEEEIEPIEEEVTEEPVKDSEVEEEIAETKTIDDTQKEDFEIFRKEIDDYSITEKAFEYSTAVLDIMNDYIDVKTKTLKMSKEEVGSRFLKLSSKVRSDYFIFFVVKDNILKDKGISNITPDMIKAVDLIFQWSEIKEREFKYTAKHYWGEGAEYEIKADELSDEARAIADEYHNLRNSMYLSIYPE